MNNLIKKVVNVYALFLQYTICNTYIIYYIVCDIRHMCTTWNRKTWGKYFAKLIRNYNLPSHFHKKRNVGDAMYTLICERAKNRKESQEYISLLGPYY